MKIEDIKTKEDIHQWLKEQEERIKIRCNSIILFDEAMSLQLHPGKYTSRGF